MRKYNWKKDKADHRDIKFSKPLTLSTLPASVDLRPFCSPVFDQGEIGSCTGNALAGALEFLEMSELKKNLVSQPEEFGLKFSNISRLFIYWNERVMEGDPKQDGGAEIRDGIKSLATIGACEESVWSYSKSNLFNKPSTAAFSEASKHKITKYMRINNINDMKQSLADGYPFVFGFTVFPQFESEQMEKDGILQMPKNGEQNIGGHAVMACGYDDAAKHFIVRNSWGPDWGLQGYFTIPYAYITNPNLADDMWTIRL